MPSVEQVLIVLLVAMASAAAGSRGTLAFAPTGGVADNPWKIF